VSRYSTPGDIIAALDGKAGTNPGDFAAVGSDGLLPSAVIPPTGGSPLTTKGDIYTFAAADAKLPVGAPGEVLSADAAEATGLKWIPAAAGASKFDAEVAPSGADYTTIAAAMAAGKTSILVSGATTETSHTFAGEEVYVFVNPGVVVTFPDLVEWDFAITASKLTFESTGRGGKTLWTGASTQLFQNTDLAELRFISMEHETVAPSVSSIINNFVGLLSHVDCLLKQYSGGLGGWQVTGSVSGVYLIDCEFFGTGSADDIYVINTSDQIHVQGLIISGAWGSRTAVFTSGITPFSGLVEAVTVDATTDIVLQFTRITVQSVVSVTAFAVNVTLGDDVNISNAKVDTLTMTNVAGAKAILQDCRIETLVLNGSTSQVKLIDCTIADALTVAADECEFIRCVFDSTLTLSGDRIKVRGGVVTGLVTLSGDGNSIPGMEALVGVSVTGDRNRCNDIVAGVINTGAAAHTITISAAADLTIATGCLTDAAISDSGTNSQLGFNGVF